GTPAMGDEKSLKAIEVKDCKAYYDSYYTAKGTTLTIVGDISEAEAMAKLAFLKKWAGKTVAIAPIPAAPQYASTQIFFLDKPGAPQSQVRMGCMAMP